MGETILMLGGARSGKSRMAAQWAQKQPPVTYMATAAVDPDDVEMVRRVARHRADRPVDWATVEVAGDLAGALAPLVEREGSVVVDCVTLWVTGLMLGLGGAAALDDDAILGETRRAAGAARGRARVVWVSNEVGSGIVPAEPLGRRFVDLQGLVNQALAEVCDQVFLCVAGVPLRIKGRA